MRNKQVNDLIERIKSEKLIDIDKNGVGTVKEGAVAKLLPEDITPEILDKATEAKLNIGSALAIVFGTESKAVFDEHKDLKSATINAGLSKFDSVNVLVERVKELPPSGFSESKEPVLKHGYATVKWETTNPTSNSVIRKEIQKHWAGVSD